MSGTTDNLGIAEVATNQTDKEMIISTALNDLDDATQNPLPITFVSNSLSLTATQFTRNYCFIGGGGGNLTAEGTLTVPGTPRQFGIWNRDSTYEIEITTGAGSTCAVGPDSFNVIYSDGTNCGVSTVDAVIDVVTDAAPFLNNATLSSGDTITAATLAAQSLIGNKGSVGAVPSALSIASQFTINSGGTFGFNTSLIDFSSMTEVKVPTPVNAADAVTKAYADAAIQGLQVKPTATVVTTSALPTNTYSNGTSGVGATITINATGTLTIDSHLTALGDVILVSQEATGANNGLFTVTTAGASGVAAVLTRSVDMDASAQFTGAIIPVSEVSTTYPGTLWICNQTAPTVGSTSVSFTQMNPPGSAASGTGITVSGTVVNLSNIASLDILANITGGSAAPIPNTLSAIFDAIIGSNEGMVIVRGASAWEGLAAGASSYALVSNGTSTVPSWQAQTGGGSGEWAAGSVTSVLSTQLEISSDVLQMVDGPTITSVSDTFTVLANASATPPTIGSISANIQLVGGNNFSNAILLNAWGSTNPESGLIAASRAKGTNASPTAVTSGVDLFQFQGWGYDGTNYHNSVEIIFSAAENFGTTAAGGQIDFLTINTGGTSAATSKMRIGNEVLIGSTTASGSLALQVTGGILVDNLDVSGTLAALPMTGNSIALNNGSIVSGGTLSYSPTAAGTVTLAPTLGIKDVIVNFPSAGAAIVLKDSGVVAYQEYKLHLKQGATVSTVTMPTDWVFANGGGPTTYTLTATASLRDILWVENLDGTHSVYGAILQGISY